MNTVLESVKDYISKNTKVVSHGNTVFFEVPAAEIITVAKILYSDTRCTLKLITATDEREEYGCFKIWYVFGAPGENILIVPFIQVTNKEEFPSLAPVIHGAWNYERKIQTFFGLRPIGHPDKRSIILHENWPTKLFPLRKDFDWKMKPERAHGTYHFQKINGEGIYQIPVGPIHAGIIEPGHFRFSVAGEEILLLEARLGFTHKGSEKIFENISLSEKVHLSEKISGDSSLSHSLAFCQAVEQLGDVEVSRRVRYLRVIYAELERLANHFGDIGAIMLDTGFSFGGSHGARLREMIMQINDRLTGSRFLRGVNIVGGVTKNITHKGKNELMNDLKVILKDFSEVVEVAGDSVSLLNRLKGTGILSLGVAEDHGVVGVAARAVGITRDTRVNHPYAGYDEITVREIPIEQDGDVYARFCIRVKEVYESVRLIQHALHELPEGQIGVTRDIKLKKNSLAISCVEGWRGEIVYFITTNSHGNISRVAPRDPSFINWAALGHAGIDNVVPDFPLINKSFNLSYSGNDL